MTEDRTEEASIAENRERDRIRRRIEMAAINFSDTSNDLTYSDIVQFASENGIVSQKLLAEYEGCLVDALNLRRLNTQGEPEPVTLDQLKDEEDSAITKAKDGHGQKELSEAEKAQRFVLKHQAELEGKNYGAMRKFGHERGFVNSVSFSHYIAALETVLGIDHVEERDKWLEGRYSSLVAGTSQSQERSQGQEISTGRSHSMGHGKAQR